MKDDKKFSAFFAACAEYERLHRKAGISRLPQFFAVRELVEAALAEGRSVRTIWKVLSREGKFTGNYNCLLNYVKRYINELPQNAAGSERLPEESSAQISTDASLPAPAASVSKGKWTPETKTRAFNYNSLITDKTRRSLFGMPADNKQEKETPEKS